MFRLVSNDGAKALLSYKYVGHDKGLLSRYVMQPWWRFCVELLPLWLAPNVVTLTALAWMTVAYALSVIYTPSLTETAPGWVYAFNGVAMFIYQTLDAIDGKQARRTHSSSPLGELFDHGCDAVNTVFTIITTASALQLGGTYIYFWFCTSIYFSFFLAQWEEYHTHIMEFPPLGVTEGHFLYMLLMFVTAYFTPSFWQTPINLSSTFSVTYGAAYVSMGIVGAFLGAISSATRVIEKIQSGAVSFLDATMRLSPAVLLHAGAIAWLHLLRDPPSSPLSYPHLFELLRGFITAHIVGKTILARVTLSRFPYFPVASLGPWLPVVTLCISGLLPVALTLKIYLIYAIIIYHAYAYRMIRELCAILKIRAFHIKPKQ